MAAARGAPGTSRSFPLQPDCVAPQDGPAKPDGERAAVTRGLAAPGAVTAWLQPVDRGDARDAGPPSGEQRQALGGDVICTANAAAPKTLDDGRDGAQLHGSERRPRNGRPQDPLCDTWRNARPWRAGRQRRRIGPASTVEARAAGGRARGTIEHEPCTVLKLTGDTLQHHCGPGAHPLAAPRAPRGRRAFALPPVGDTHRKTSFACVCLAFALPPVGDTARCRNRSSKSAPLPCLPWATRLSKGGGAALLRLCPASRGRHPGNTRAARPQAPGGAGQLLQSPSPQRLR